MLRQYFLSTFPYPFFPGGGGGVVGLVWLSLGYNEVLGSTLEVLVHIAGPSPITYTFEFGYADVIFMHFLAVSARVFIF